MSANVTLYIRVFSFISSDYPDQSQQAGAKEPDGWGNGDSANIAIVHSPRVVVDAQDDPSSVRGALY